MFSCNCGCSGGCCWWELNQTWMWPQVPWLSQFNPPLSLGTWRRGAHPPSQVPPWSILCKVALHILDVVQSVFVDSVSFWEKETTFLQDGPDRKGLLLQSILRAEVDWVSLILVSWFLKMFVLTEVQGYCLCFCFCLNKGLGEISFV